MKPGAPLNGPRKTDGSHPVQFFDPSSGPDQFNKAPLGPSEGRAATPPAEKGDLWRNPPMSEWGPPSVSGESSEPSQSGWAPGTNTQGYGQARGRR